MEVRGRWVKADFPPGWWRSPEECVIWCRQQRKPPTGDEPPKKKAKVSTGSDQVMPPYGFPVSLHGHVPYRQPYPPRIISPCPLCSFCVQYG
jgi:hypothetical protein